MTPLSGRARPVATMRDVAALAGVSLKTVSRVVNREPGVSDQVTSRVERAVRQLGYRHNLAASNLRRTAARTAMIGALVQDVSNSFSGSLLRSLEGAARSRDMVIVASSLDEEPERERYLVESLLRRRVDGLLLMPATQRQDYLVEAVYGRLPVVFVDRRPQGVDVDSVTVDNAHGARLGVEHLMAHGHERIAILGDRVEIQTARDRLDGFMRAMRAAGLEPPAAHVAMSMRSEEEATDAVYRMLDSGQRPTAFFAARNSLTMGAIRALRQRGLEREVAVVGFDDFPMADMVDPPVTVISQDLGQIGAETTRLLFARIDGADGPPERIVLVPELVPRGSGEIRR